MLPLMAITGFFHDYYDFNLFSAFDTEIEKLRSIENFISCLPERPISLNSPHKARNLGSQYKTEKELFYQRFLENSKIQDNMSDSWALKALKNEYQ